MALFGIRHSTFFRQSSLGIRHSPTNVSNKQRPLRGWAVPAIFVCLAALLTWPWTLWVVEAAYERDVNEKSDRIAQRVKIHLSNPTPWTRQEQVLDPLKAELLGDQTVQAVAFLD